MKYTYCILILVTMLATDMTCVGNTNDPVDPGGKGRGSGNQGSPDDPGGKGDRGGKDGTGGKGDLRNQGGTDGKDISVNPSGPGNLGRSDGTGALHNQNGSADSEEERILGQYFSKDDLASIMSSKNMGNVCKLFKDEPLEQYEKGKLFQEARCNTNLSGQGRATLVRKLNEKKSNPDLESIKQACQWSDVYMLEALIKPLKDKKTVLNQYIKSPFNAMETILYIAVRKGKGAIVQVLLDEGADPNKGTSSVGDDGTTTRTPLYGAVRKGYVEIVRALLKAGVDPNKGTTVEGKDETTTPLALAKKELEESRQRAGNSGEDSSDGGESEKDRQAKLEEIIDLLKAKGAK